MWDRPQKTVSRAQCPTVKSILRTSDVAATWQPLPRPSVGRVGIIRIVVVAYYYSRSVSVLFGTGRNSCSRRPPPPPISYSTTIHLRRGNHRHHHHLVIGQRRARPSSSVRAPDDRSPWSNKLKPCVLYQSSASFRSTIAIFCRLAPISSRTLLYPPPNSDDVFPISFAPDRILIYIYIHTHAPVRT